jgi:hypothetical protein
MAKGVRFVQASGEAARASVDIKNTKNATDSSVREKSLVTCHDAKRLDEEIQKNQKRAEHYKGTGVDVAAAGDARQGSHHFRGDYFQARLSAGTIKGADRRVARQVALIGSDLVVDPHVDIIASAPDLCGTSNEGQVAEKS